MKRFPSTCLFLGFLAFGATARASLIFDYTGSEQTFTADTMGIYEIIVMGAEGGLYGAHPQVGGEGGGAEIAAFFSLTTGDSLDIYVGQKGFTGATNGGGGGGGSFVVTVAGAPLIVAGGGGGAGTSGAADMSRIGGQTGTSGGSNIGDGGAGGTAGNGGHGGSYTTVDGNAGRNGGGGAGFYGNGLDGISAQSGHGGSDFPTFSGGSSGPVSGLGGYGGGGGGSIGGGGGGGYSGGGGGNGDGGSGGGGGSYLDIAGTLDFVTGNVNFGDGQVQILLVSPQFDTPEPASFVLGGLGVMLLAGMRRRLFAAHTRV